MKKLSPQQQQVYNFVERYCIEKGFCPSLADVARGLNLHDSTVAAYTNILKKKGYVVSEYRVARSLRAVDPEKGAEKPVVICNSNESEADHDGNNL